MMDREESLMELKDIFMDREGSLTVGLHMSNSKVNEIRILYFRIEILQV